LWRFTPQGTEQRQSVDAAGVAFRKVHVMDDQTHVTPSNTLQGVGGCVHRVRAEVVEFEENEQRGCDGVIVVGNENGRRPTGEGHSG
jgi:protein involved in ribonucleotide reduction